MSKRLAILVILNCCVINFAISAPQKSQLKIDPATISAVGNLFRSLRNDPNVLRLLKTVQSNFMNAAMLGLAMGCANVERKMELSLVNKLNDFAKTARESKDTAQVAAKLRAIDKTMYRDRKSLDILVSAMDFVARRDNHQTMKIISKDKSEFKPSTTSFRVGNETVVENMINDLHERVKQHFKLMRERANASSSSAIENLRRHSTTPLSADPSKATSQRKEKLSLVIGGGSTPPGITPPSSSSSSDNVNHLNEAFNHIPHHWLPPLYVHYYLPLHEPPKTSHLESFYRFRRQNEVTTETAAPRDKEKQEEESGDEFSDEFDTSNGGSDGGILGIIASLSSNEGADVGAIAGLISTVVTNLLGPNGLDIPSVLGGGASLLNGLLSGGENFGKVVASYLGILIEGFSGGGGADNNGVFFGNFVGTLFAYLSADPEEESGPKPDLFFKSFKEGFDQTENIDISKRKRAASRADEMPANGQKRSYFFEFISNIISSLVGGVTNFIANASLGSSGGSSQGSAEFSKGSSSGSHAGSAYASKSSHASSIKPMAENVKKYQKI